MFTRSELERHVDDYIEECLAERCQPRVEELASRLGISRATLVISFRSLLGTTPSAELKRRQMLRASELLQRGLPITEVAQMSGYGSYQSFYNAWRRVFGSSPATGRPARDQPEESSDGDFTNK
jgi:AraC-like DNA-binding protein